jgi:hypothetical protein
MSNNFRKYPKTKARIIQGLSRLLYKFQDIQALNFCFQIQGHSSLVQTLHYAKFANTKF